MIAPESLAAIEEVLRRVAQRSFGDQAVRRASLATAITDLSHLYTHRRDQPGPISTDRSHAAARLLFFTMADLPKLTYPLGELTAMGRIPQDPSGLRILDVGAGFGAQTLGLLASADRLGWSAPLTIRAVDQDPLALDLLEQVLEPRDGMLGPPTRLETVRTDLTRPALDLDGPYDLVLVGSVLNEIPEERRKGLVLGLLSALAPAGHLIVVEPALKSTARILHQLRDHLISTGAAQVVAPCTRTGTCPMLDTDSDWCHERRNWSPPPGIRALARATGLRRGSLKWSYLTLATESSPTDATAWRMVSDPLPSKGKLELFLCGAPGRIRVVRLNRHRSEYNRPIQRLRRGWLTWIDGAELEAGVMRVGRDSIVRVADPAVGGS